MPTTALLLLTLALLPLASSATAADNLTICKPRALTLRLRAEKPFPISVYRSCPTGDGGSFNCGGPFDDIVALRCTEKACAPGARCNTCTAKLVPRRFPRFYATHAGAPVLGRYLLQLRDAGDCLFLEFDSDFENSGPDWFARHNYVAACKDRVTCLSRKGTCIFKDPPFDMALSVQGCDAQLFEKSTVLSSALSLRRCANGKFDPPSDGPPAGEVVGTDCPARLL